MLSERLIPFVALDVSASRVQEGKKLDLPVYFGDAGSPAVLHAVGAERAACAVITLDTAGANYRSVWAMHKHFPHVKTFVRAFDIENGGRAGWWSSVKQGAPLGPTCAFAPSPARPQPVSARTYPHGPCTHLPGPQA
jgi:voltage-gated potassium channel Kch